MKCKNILHSFNCFFWTNSEVFFSNHYPTAAAGVVPCGGRESNSVHHYSSNDIF